VDVSEATVREFIDRINRHDVEGIITLCAHAHRFVDGLGQVLTGYDQLRVAWSGYFNLFPDYRIDIESLAVDRRGRAGRGLSVGHCGRGNTNRAALAYSRRLARRGPRRAARVVAGLRGQQTCL
jgi:ketosteroid isomerase-like protein